MSTRQLDMSCAASFLCTAPKWRRPQRLSALRPGWSSRPASCWPRTCTSTSRASISRLMQDMMF